MIYLVPFFIHVNNYLNNCQWVQREKEKKRKGEKGTKRKREKEEDFYVKDKCWQKGTCLKRDMSKKRKRY